MLGSVKGRPLPDEVSGTKYERTDQTSFLDVYVEGRRVLGSCVSTNEELGWASAGEPSMSFGNFRHAQSKRLKHELITLIWNRR